MHLFVTNLLKTTLWTGTLFLSVNIIAAEAEDRMEKTFHVAPGGQLVVDVDRGAIEVKTADASQVNIEVVRKASTRGREKPEDVLKNHTVEMTQQGNDVRIQSEFKGQSGRFWSNWGRQLNVRYVITVPKKYHTDLKTAGGSIAIADLEGAVRAKTSGGSLRFGRIQGPVWGRTSGGGITIDACKQVVDVETSGGSLNIGEVEGPVTAKTSGGSIRIKRAKGDVLARTSGGSINVDEVFGKIEATTSGGSVSARLSNQPKGDCVLKTSGGSINVQLAGNIAVDLDASTSGGRVVTDIPVTVQGEIKKTALKSKLNGGGPALVLHTSGGNVHIRRL